jgi:hypothetical protein
VICQLQTNRNLSQAIANMLCFALPESANYLAVAGL